MRSRIGEAFEQGNQTALYDCQEFIVLLLKESNVHSTDVLWQVVKKICLKFWKNYVK
jgi:hypothetical protein